MEHTLAIPGTDLTVSPMALGCTKAGAWKGERADRVLDCYAELGGNVLDTARIYGLPRIGASEEMLGEWLRRSGKRGQMVLMSKGGHPDVIAMHKPRMRRTDMEADLHASLTALQTDCIDIFFYHRDDEAQPVGELIEQMEDFRRAGKIRYYACSNWTTARQREAAAYAASHGLTGFVGSECLYNYGCGSIEHLADDTLCMVDAEMLAYHREPTCRTLLMPYSGLCEGFFHKLMNPGLLGTLPVMGNQYYTPGNLAKTERIRMLQEKYHATVSQVLVGFLSTRDVPLLPLYGCSTPEHLLEIAAALDMPFEAADFD